MSEEIRPNSNKYRESLKKNEVNERGKPLLEDEAFISKKPSKKKKLIRSIFNKDIEDIRDYLIYDVAIPSIKGIGLNVVSMMFYGEPIESDIFPGGKKKKKTYDRASYGSNRSSSRRNRRREYDEEEDVDYQDIVLKRREDAEKIVDEIRYRIKETGECSVAELYDMINVAGESADNDYGWTNGRDVGVKKIYGGYLIDVAEAKYLL